MKKQRYASVPKQGQQGFQATHGMSQSPEYRTWAAMIRRCHLPGSSGYEKYGARGIYVCDEWRASFEAFFASMGRRPSPQHSIEREDNDGPYAPHNCTWATTALQAYNKRNTALLSHDGKTMSLRAWSEETGIPYQTIKCRFYRGSSPERILHPGPLMRENTDFNRGERSSCSRLTEENVREIRRLRDDGMKMKDIGDKFGVALATVDSILKRRTWAWLD